MKACHSYQQHSMQGKGTFYKSVNQFQNSVTLSMLTAKIFQVEAKALNTFL